MISSFQHKYFSRQATPSPEVREESEAGTKSSLSILLLLKYILQITLIAQLYQSSQRDLWTLPNIWLSYNVLIANSKQYNYKLLINYIKSNEMYELKNEQNQQDKIEKQRKIISHFDNRIPNGFDLTANSLMGQCLIQKQVSFDDGELNKKRKKAKYITNEQQIIFMLIQDGFQIGSKFSKKQLTRIKFGNISEIKISAYYCCIMLKYSVLDIKKEQSIESYILIEDIYIGSDRKEQLRTHLIKYISINGSIAQDKLHQYTQRTLLDTQMYKMMIENQESKQSQSQMKEDINVNLIKEAEIKTVKTINLKKRVQELKATEKIINNKEVTKNIYNYYKFFEQLPSASDQFYYYYKILIAAKEECVISPTSIENLLIIYVIDMKWLKKNHQFCQAVLDYYRSYKDNCLITPYIPRLTKSLYFGSLFSMEYSYFQGQTLRQLKRKSKINIDKKEVLRQLIGQIVMGLGHIHECGYIYSVNMDNIIVNYDGHVLFPSFVSIKRYDQNEKKEQQKKIIKSCSPEEVNEGQYLYISDWWKLGLLIHELITGKHLFESLTDGQIQRDLQNLTKRTNFKQFQKMKQRHNDVIQLGMCLLEKDKNKRVGCKNDYHSVLDMEYFKGLDKRKLMRREGEQITKIKRTKVKKQLKNRNLIESVSQQNYQNQVQMSEVRVFSQIEKEFQNINLKEQQEPNF